MADTVIDVNEQTLAANTASGLVLELANTADLVEAVNRALRLYRNQKNLRQVRLSAMSKNFSWEKSSLEYERIYRLALKKKVMK